MADNDSASQSAEVGTWLSEIDRAQKAMKKWQSRCDQIRKRYRYESSADSKVRRYQMLWSNMETMKPSVMSKLPRAEVMRRFNDKDPTARVASEMLERCINVTLDTNDYEETFNQVRDDYLLYGRGQARVYYEPVTQFMEPSSTDGLDVEAVEGDAAFVSINGFLNTAIWYISGSSRFFALGAIAKVICFSRTS